MTIFTLIMISVLISVLCTVLLMLAFYTLFTGWNPFVFGRKDLRSMKKLQEQVDALEKHVRQLERSASQDTSDQPMHEMQFSGRPSAKHDVQEYAPVPASRDISPEEIPLPQVKNVTIVPDEMYLCTLLTELLSLKGKLDDDSFNACRIGFERVMNSEHRNDPDSVMAEIHHLISRYVHESDTRIPPEYLDDIHRFLESAGYRPFPVREEMELEQFKELFCAVFPIKGGVQGTIQKIERMPYALHYANGVRTCELVLYGKCYYNL